MRSFAIISLVILSGCSAPSLGMRGAEKTEVTVGSSHFVVHRLGNRAEAVRTNFEAGPAARGVMARGRRAIELGTGCQLVPGTFDGDPALMRAKLFCPPVS